MQTADFLQFLLFLISFLFSISLLLLLFSSFFIFQVLDAARSRLARCLRERARVLDLTCHTMSASGTSGRRTPTPTRPRSMENLGVGARSSQVQFSADPQGAFTPEAEQALREAKDARTESTRLRTDLAEAISRTDQLQRAAHASVNNGLLQKLAETVTLKVSTRQMRRETLSKNIRASRDISYANLESLGSQLKEKHDPRFLFAFR